MTDVVVIGSINMDLVVQAPTIPAPGETLLADRLATVSGGKGANQAVAAARLGTRVAIVGRVGDDTFGQTLRNGLATAGVQCQHVLTTPQTSSGVALIVVATAGENAICVVPGANACLTPSDIDTAEDLIANARVCLLQLEIPLKTAIHAAQVAKKHGVEVILDPAPAPDTLPDELFTVDAITPNETEAARLLGVAALDTPQAAAGALRARGAQSVVLTLGSRGSYLGLAGGDELLDGHAVDVVDTTAAGDAFAGALAACRAAGMEWPAAGRFANAAGALACTVFGAQPSAPTRAAVEALLAAR